MNKGIIKSKALTWKIDNQVILDNLNFTIDESKFIGVIGPNGSGKTSLLRCLYQQINPTSGDLIFNGKNINDYSKISLAKQIAVVLQESPMQFDMNVVDVVKMGLIPHKGILSFDTAEDKKAINVVIKQVCLENQMTQSFNSLSGGEKQRAMIARALLQQPKVLIMDEPTNHLDIRHQIDILKLAKSLGITVIVSLHDLNLAATFCDQLILLNNGKIVEQGIAEQVLTKSNLQQVFSVEAKIESCLFNTSVSDNLHISFNLDS